MPTHTKLSRTGTATAALLLALLGLVAVRPTGPLPPFGLFADPVRGLVGSVRYAELADNSVVTLTGLGAETRVLYDDRGVPHIFAANRHDAYRALGYVTARDRLFQIELQARAGAGTLTGLVGARGWSLDKAVHELGMPLAAEKRAAAYDKTSDAWLSANAYAEGINAYADNLAPAAYPIEYKLLGARPKRWEPIDIFHLLNRMGLVLAYSEDELVFAEAAARIGRNAATILFPPHNAIVQPIQPNGSTTERVEAIAVPPPGKPDSTALAFVELMRPVVRANMSLDIRAVAAGASAPDTRDYGSRADAIGSNNWAVAPSHTSSGKALLAGDPHLELTLPSIWYEVHIVVPDTLDVYGVSIPGAPGVTIGFNRYVAWTFTNTGADVADYYVEEVDNVDNPTRYLVDGEYRPLEMHVARGRGQDGKLTGDSVVVRWSHRGPVRKVGSKWVSMRWTVLEAARDVEAFQVAAMARSARGLLDSMAAYYTAPAQNMLAADIGGTIAIRSTGKYPLRPGDGRGDRFADGSTSTSDWTGFWSIPEYPQAFNPEQGYLASANQEPMDRIAESHYLGANWERPWRAMRINKLLRENAHVTADDMRRYQTDPGSARADWFVPAFLEAAKTVTPTQKLMRASQLLAEWDRTYTPTNTRTVLFEAAMTELNERLWDEFDDGKNMSPRRPTDEMTAILLGDPDNIWWDDRRTEIVETRDELLAQVLEKALDIVTEKAGDPDDERWQWHNFRVANINHLLGMPSFSRRGIPVQGGPATLWPSFGSGGHGPSWRMVVELDSVPVAWGTYPGGQSGNPLSARYDDRIDQWSRGELDRLLIPAKPADLPPERVGARLTLRPMEKAK